MEEESFLKELLCLLPFFVLHLSSGMSGSFTTVLIEHYEQLNTTSSSPSSSSFSSSEMPSGEKSHDMMEAMIGTFQDIPPIIVAVLGGFLQQLFGPRKLLVVSTIPSIFSWVFVAMSPDSVSCLLLSRVCAGLANGLLSGNVYMSNIASPKFIGSFKMIEIASKNIGSILLFLGMLCFKSFGLSFLSCVSLIFPVLGMVGMLFARESPLFNARHKISREMSLEENRNPVKAWLHENLQRLKFPISSPTVYKPLVLITALMCLQQCSGAVYIKKFIIQILSTKEIGCSFGSSFTNRSTVPANVGGEIVDSNIYILPIVILMVRLIVIFMMTFLLQKLRVRFLYFSSLFLTVIILFSLGLVSDIDFSSSFFSPTTTQYIKTVLLCSHVFFIQFGIQTLPGLLIDILFPTSCKAVMKGLTRAISSVCLIFFVFIFKSFCYSHAFFIMAALLLFSCPFLYLFVPEIRNIGTDMSAEFFLPTQTVLYFVLPENMKGSPEARKNAMKHWKSAVRKISNISSIFERTRVDHQIGVDKCARKFTKVRFDDAIPSINDVKNNPKYAKLNSERLSFVSNVLGHNGFLCDNPSSERVLIGRGPIVYKNEMMKKGSIFLFTDVIILAKCVVSNRRYVREIFYKLDDPTVCIKKVGQVITFSEASCIENQEIEFEDESLAIIWEKYISFWMLHQNIK